MAHQVGKDGLTFKERAMGLAPKVAAEEPKPKRKKAPKKSG